MIISLENATDLEKTYSLYFFWGGVGGIGDLGLLKVAFSTL